MSLIPPPAPVTVDDLVVALGRKEVELLALRQRVMTLEKLLAASPGPTLVPSPDSPPAGPGAKD